MKMQNYKNISYPAGYATFQDYYETLKSNLAFMEKQPKKYAKLISSYKDSIKEAESVL